MGKVVLIVDDEESIRGLLQAMLSEEYTVVLAKDGVEAYQLFRQMDGALDLVLTDLFMPGMSGSQLAEKLQTEKPGLPILFMSGVVDETPATAPFIQKPFTQSELEAAVQDALTRIPKCGRADSHGVA